MGVSDREPVAEKPMEVRMLGYGAVEQKKLKDRIKLFTRIEEIG